MQLAAQTWGTAALMLLAVGYLGQTRLRVASAEAAFDRVALEQVQTRREVKELDETMHLQRELLSKQRLVAQLGIRQRRSALDDDGGGAAVAVVEQRVERARHRTAPGRRWPISTAH